MHLEGQEIVLDMRYEMESGVLPPRFPLSGVADAIERVRARTQLPKQRERRANLAEYGQYSSDSEETQLLSIEHTQLQLMLLDLQRLQDA